jgi:pilus assembly protein Flp/PilA
MKNLEAVVRRFLLDERGPSAVEYAIMLALIVGVCLATIGTLGVNTKQVCNTICTVVYGS